MKDKQREAREAASASPFHAEYTTLVDYAKKQRDELKRELKRKKPVVLPKDGPLDFWDDEAMYGILDTIDIKRDQTIDFLEAIELSKLTPNEKEAKVQKAIENYQKEVNDLVRNGNAFVESVMLKQPRRTREAIAEILILAERYKKIQNTPRGAKLVEIYADFVNGTGLSESHKQVLDKAITGVNTLISDAAFMMLAMCKADTRKKYTKHFIKNHPEDVAIFLDGGSLHGAYPPAEFMEYVYMAVESADPTTQAYAKSILDTNPAERTAALTQRYQTQGLVKKFAKGLKNPGAKGGAQKYLNAKGLGIFFAYTASASAIIANTIANRKVLMKDPVDFFKNPYLTGGIATQLWLHQRSKGETLTSFFEAKEKKIKRERLANLAKLNEVVDRSEYWKYVLQGDSSADNVIASKKSLIGYAQLLKNKNSFSGQKPTIKKYNKFLSEKGGESIAPYDHEKITAEDELGRIVKLIQDLDIQSPDQFDAAIKEANRKT